MTYNYYALKEATLASNVTASSTTIKIKNLSYATRDGEVTLKAGTLNMILDAGTDTREFARVVLSTDVTTVNNSLTFTNVVRNVSPTSVDIYAGTDTGTTGYPHGAGARIMVSPANPQHFGEFAIKSNPEKITAQWEFPSPVTAKNPATKEFVESIALGGGTSTDRVIIDGQAGEDLSYGNLIYLKKSDSKWYKINTNDILTIGDVQKGFCNGNTTSQSQVSGGILLIGQFTTSGLTPGATYYANGVGSISTSPASNKLTVGVAISSTILSVSIPEIRDELLTAIYNSGASSSTPFAVINSSFGDGSDSNIVLDGTNTYSFLTKSTNEYTMTRNIYANNLTINSNCTLLPNGYAIFVKGKLLGTGKIKTNGVNGARGQDRFYGTGKIAGTSLGGVPTESGPYKGIRGGNGGIIQGSAEARTSVIGIGSTGTNGGNGGGSGLPGATGGASSTNGQLYKFGIFKLPTLLLISKSTALAEIILMPQGSSGGGGAGQYSSNGGNGDGGGAGSSGGLLPIFVNDVSGTITIESIGGNGGNGGEGNSTSGAGLILGGGGGGGAGGNGGSVVLIYQTWSLAINEDITTTLTGGTGGSGGPGGAGTGANGANGASGTLYKILIGTLI